MTRAIVTGAVMVSMFGVLVACGSKPASKTATTTTTTVDASAPDEGGADSGAPVSDGFDWLLLADMDAIPPTPPVPKPESYAKFTDTKIKTWRKSKKECTGKGDGVISVDGGYEGEFTTKGAKEVLVLVTVAPCDDKIPATHNLIVLNGGKVKVNQAIPEDDILTVKDLDLDGDQEIVVVTTATPQKARLVDTEEGKFEQLNDFGVLPSGSCDNGKATGDTALIKYRKTDTGIAYKIDSRPKTCPK